MVDIFASKRWGRGRNRERRFAASRIDQGVSKAGSPTPSGWCIVAWGEYSNGSKEGAELFKKIESKFGDIAVPSYVCFEDRFLRNVTPYCFSSREPSEPVTNLGAIPP